MWNPTKYLNVFIADNGAVGLGTRLFAQGTVPVWGSQGLTDTNGRWKQFRHFSVRHDALMYQPRELANVLAHEVGHPLSLSHPFALGQQGCPSSDPDGVDDTPVYDVVDWVDLASLMESGVPVRLYKGCVGRPSTEVNVMGYTTFHKKSFTYSQRKRMQYQLAWAYLYPTPINQTR